MRSKLFLAGFMLLSVIAMGENNPAPYPPLPSPPQLAWHKAEYRMFVHFGMKTFHPSDNHMGNGNENPNSFNPRKFDARQWVMAAKAGGFEGIVLTTKHHDGFCNWQTDTTDHCVRSSSWQNGKGDVVRDVIKACHEAGLSFGLYVSIIDKHFEKHGSPKYKKYGDYYLAQIKELSTRYGPVEEYWFDGYQSGKTKINYRAVADIIRKQQPDAVVYDSGVLVKYLPERCLAWPGHHGGVTPDPNYRQQINGKLHWYPQEPSIILQGNWFHNGQPAVSLQRMQEYYLTSVGYGVTPLMNISPNQDGLIDDATVARLKEFKAWIDKVNKSNLLSQPGVQLKASSQLGSKTDKYALSKLTDNNFDSYYAPTTKKNEAVIEADFGTKQKISGFVIQEYIPLGQRVTGYTIDGLVGEKWQELFSGRRIGYKRIILEGHASAKKVKFPAVRAIRLKLRGEASPLISSFRIISL